ncbi:hypothetical protein BDV23DRAFT_172270 [Aspergillus alliaceus]|uniref:Uncharacterized protein n=1 Tax=Petromyces alliaceus TaxID=209559 RepID=A0A5N7C936_PETAA|nr:hypothetical protein BDV23DRAFT_172270 [Aspergillus alliaceus]
MHDLLGDSPSSPPGDSPSCLGAAQQGQCDPFRSVAYNQTWILGQKYCQSGDSIDICEPHLHDLWYTYSQCTGPAPSGFGVDLARTPDGTVWNDLLFLATDMADFWLNGYAAMSGTSVLMLRHSLLSLLQRVLRKIDWRPHGFLQCADQSCWAKHILLSDVSWNDCSSNYYFGKRSFGGFSPWRWLYWLKRLHEIVDEAVQADGKSLAEHATRAINIMVENVKTRNSQILKVSEAAGADLDHDEHFSGLEKK